MNEFQRIRKSGHSLIVTIPKPMVDELRLVQGDHVLFTMDKDTLRMKRIHPDLLVRTMARTERKS